MGPWVAWPYTWVMESPWRSSQRTSARFNDRPFNKAPIELAVNKYTFHLSIYMSIYLCIYLTIYLSIFLSFYKYIPKILCVLYIYILCLYYRNRNPYVPNQQNYKLS